MEQELALEQELEVMPVAQYEMGFKGARDAEAELERIRLELEGYADSLHKLSIDRQEGNDVGADMLGIWSDIAMARAEDARRAKTCLEAAELCYYDTERLAYERLSGADANVGEGEDPHGGAAEEEPDLAAVDGGVFADWANSASNRLGWDDLRDMLDWQTIWPALFAMTGGTGQIDADTWASIKGFIDTKLGVGVDGNDGVDDDEGIDYNDGYIKAGDGDEPPKELERADSAGKDDDEIDEPPVAEAEADADADDGGLPDQDAYIKTGGGSGGGTIGGGGGALLGAGLAAAYGDGKDWMDELGMGDETESTPDTEQPAEQPDDEPAGTEPDGPEPAGEPQPEQIDGEDADADPNTEPDADADAGEISDSNEDANKGGIAAPIVGAATTASLTASTGLGLSNKLKGGKQADGNESPQDLPVVAAKKSGGVFSGELKGEYVILGSAMTMLFSGISVAAGLKRESKTRSPGDRFRIGYGKSAVLNGAWQ